MSHSFTIAAIGGSGPKATAVNFLKTEDGIRLWAWVANETAKDARPGMTVIAEQASFGKLETTYEKAGRIETLKVPKVQVFLGGKVIVDAPESESLSPVEVEVTDKARAYARAYDAKKASPVIDDDEAF